MLKEADKAKSLICPECGKANLYTRIDGSVRCSRCGYDSRPGGKSK